MTTIDKIFNVMIFIGGPLAMLNLYHMQDFKTLGAIFMIALWVTKMEKWFP